MNPKQTKLIIGVDYFRNIDRVPNLAFARALMQYLDVELIHVRATAPGADMTHLAEEQATRIRQDVSRLTQVPEDCVVIVPDFPPGALIIDNFPDRNRQNLIWLAPMDERGLTTRHRGSANDASFMVPFGNGNSCLKALQLAAPIARGSGAALLFYHTTWKIPGLASVKADDHMCREAIAIRKALEEEATAQSLPFRTLIETADDVADGIVQAAVLQRSRLIVMPRSQTVEVGDYCLRVFDKSPVPVITIGKEVTS